MGACIRHAQGYCQIAEVSCIMLLECVGEKIAADLKRWSRFVTDDRRKAEDKEKESQVEMPDFRILMDPLSLLLTFISEIYNQGSRRQH